jgi:hypothetical protein
VAARVVGHCGYLLLSLLMYPVSKQSVFAHLYGSHFPRILAFHRYAGTAAFVVVTLHALLFYIIWLYDGNLWSNVVASEDLLISPACPHHDQYVTRHTLHVTLVTRHTSQVHHPRHADPLAPHARLPYPRCFLSPPHWHVRSVTCVKCYVWRVMCEMLCETCYTLL